MVENEKWKTVFGLNYGFFEFLIMNFGFCGISSAFQNYINDIYANIWIYFVLRTSTTSSFTTKRKRKKKHSKHIRLVFQNFQKTGLQLDIDKYEFYVQTMFDAELVIYFHEWKKFKLLNRTDDIYDDGFVISIFRLSKNTISPMFNLIFWR